MKHLFTILFSLTLLTGVAQEKELRLAIYKESGKSFLLKQNKTHTFLLKGEGRRMNKIMVDNYKIVDTVSVQLFLKNGIDTIVHVDQIKRIKTTDGNKGQRIIGGTLFAAGAVTTLAGYSMYTPHHGGGGGLAIDIPEGSGLLALGIPAMIGGAIVTATSIVKKTYVFHPDRAMLVFAEVEIQKEK